MFRKVNGDLSNRIQSSTEALIQQAQTSAMAKDMDNVRITKQNAKQNGVLNGNSHNSGMFAHKNWN